MRELRLQEVDSPWPWSVTYFCKLNLSIEDVLDGLIDHNVVGKGCSGQVYKVEIPGGSFIAVKKLWPSIIKQSEEQEEEEGGNRNVFGNMAVAHHDPFSCEIETLGRIRHRNIVRLLGYCNNRTEKLLLYDYMPNGSLADLLFEKKAMVDWDMRYDILVGAAHGLAYLHHDCVPAILHRDVKSNNILLDSRFQPFLADFGLAKLIRGTTGRNDDVSKVAGSYGYIAPGKNSWVTSLLNVKLGFFCFCFFVWCPASLSLSLSLPSNVSETARFTPRSIIDHCNEKTHDASIVY